MSGAHFLIGRSQRMHSDRVTVRVYQIIGTARFVWDTNREPSPDDRQYDSEAAAQEASDASLLAAGHACDAGCYKWRALE